MEVAALETKTSVGLTKSPDIEVEYWTDIWNLFVEVDIVIKTNIKQFDVIKECDECVSNLNGSETAYKLFAVLLHSICGAMTDGFSLVNVESKTIV